MSRSLDHGRTWAADPAAPPLVVVSWADDVTAVGVTAAGAVHVCDDGGHTFTALT